MAAATSGAADQFEYRLQATKRTSTLESELNQAASEGFRLEGMIGGETAFGGNELVAILRRQAGQDPAPRYEYRVLATNRTSTMEDEMNTAGETGFAYRAQTVLETAFGGREVVVVMERDLQDPTRAFEYRLLATNRTSTMEDELTEAGREGFSFVGVSVAETFIGGEEVVVITSRPKGAGASLGEPAVE